MHPSLLKLIPAQGSAPISAKGLPKSSREDFPAAIREARARLGLNHLEKTPSRIRTDQSETARGRGKVEKRKTADSPTGAIRDFEPLAVLLNASGVTPDRTTAFLNSLKADYPEGKVPMADLMGRIRTLIISETGGDGQIRLEPKSRLAVESGLTLWGLSPKEVERVLSHASTDNGPVDVEKFLRMTALHRKLVAENLKGASKSESEPGKDGRAGRAGSGENSAPADTQKTRSIASETGRAPATKAALASAGGDPASEHSSGLEGTGRQGTILSFKAEDRRAAPAAKQASDGMTVQQEKPQKSTSPSVHRKAETEEQGVAGPGRSKGPHEGDAPRRAEKEAPIEGGTPSLETRSYPAAGTGPQQTPAKPAVAAAQPLSFSEDPIPAHVAAQVSRQISRAVLNGDSTLRMHLNPPELGTLKVHLDWRQDVLKIEMVTDRHQAKDLILASVSELKEALGDQGFRVEKMEVVVHDPSGQPVHQSSREHRDPSGPGSRQQEESGFFLNEKKGEGGPEQPSSLGGHLVDLVA